MTTFRALSPGDDPAPLVDSAATWKVLTEIMNRYLNGEFEAGSRQRDSARKLWITNSAGRDMAYGEIMQISGWSDPPTVDTAEAGHQSPIVAADEPVWHTAISNLAVADSSIADGDLMAYPSRNWAVVKITSTVPGDYLMVDPTTPKHMKPASSGIYRTVAIDSTNSYAIAELTQSQPLWRYELTETPQSPSSTAAKLVELDGTDYATTIALEDPRNILAGVDNDHQGFCVHCGNEFHAIFDRELNTIQVVSDITIGAASITIERKNAVVLGDTDLVDEVVAGTECP